MTTSGTTLLPFEFADFATEAWERIGKSRDSMPGDLLRSARMSLNLMFSGEWANKGAMLFAIDLQTFPLALNDPDVPVPTGTVAILDAYLTTGAAPRDTTMAALSRSEYASLSNKLQAGRPNQFWFERLIVPIIHVWPVANATATYTMNYYRMRRIETVTAAAETLDIPELWYDAMCAGLAVRFAEKWAPERLQEKVAMAATAFELAKRENRERVPMTIRPDLTHYSRI